MKLNLSAQGCQKVCVMLPQAFAFRPQRAEAGKRSADKIANCPWDPSAAVFEKLTMLSLIMRWFMSRWPFWAVPLLVVAVGFFALVLTQPILTVPDCMIDCEAFNQSLGIR